MPPQTPRPPDLDANLQPIGGSKPPDLDASGRTVDASPAAPAEPIDPNTFGTFARHVWQMVNPVGAGQLIPFPEKWGGGGWDAPVKAVKSFHSAQEKVRQEAAAAFAKGDYLTGLRKGADWLSSVATLGGSLGLDQASDHMQQGNYAAGLGDTAGLGLSLVAPEGAEAIRRSAPMNRVADAVTASANRRMVETISPKVGPNKTRFGGMAEKVAPTLVKDVVNDGAPFSRNGLHDMVRDKLSTAEEALDAAAAARNSNQVVTTSPVLRQLQARRDALTSQSHRLKGMRAGEDVVPAPNSARVAQIDKAMDEVRRLGPIANYEALRRLRQAWDGPAKAVYSPAITADFLTAQGSKLGAADVTGVLRQTLADMDPATASANATYSIYRAANDVLEATAEVERVRPTVGRTLMAQGLGAMAGATVNHPLIGALVAPLVERGINVKVAPAMRMLMTRELGKLADGIRAQNATQIETSLRALRPLVISTTRAREPMVLQPQTAQAGTDAQREGRR